VSWLTWLAVWGWGCRPLVSGSVIIRIFTLSDSLSLSIYLSLSPLPSSASPDFELVNRLTDECWTYIAGKNPVVLSRMKEEVLSLEAQAKDGRGGFQAVAQAASARARLELANNIRWVSNRLGSVHTPMSDIVGMDASCLPGMRL
jgi:hypothetical protein